MSVGGEEKKRWVPQEQLNSLKHFQQHSRLHFIGQWKTKAHDLFKEWFVHHPEWNHGVLSAQSLFAHLDMDAFFCSVVLTKDENAHLLNQPVCIAAGKFNSDISSCNYVARAFGVRAGMYVNAAKELCPNLQVLKYDLSRCEEVITCFYNILFEVCPNFVSIAIEVLSVDEVMIAFNTGEISKVIEYCSNVRLEIERVTRCTVSCGIGPNIMTARIATTLAKPNGIHIIYPEHASDIIETLSLKKIHGIGPTTVAKLYPLLKRFITAHKDSDSKGLKEEEKEEEEEENVLCRHVQKLTKQQLQRALGVKAGETVYNLCRGIDSRVVTRTGDEKNQRLLGKRIPVTVGCSMNYAVRPSSINDIWKITKEILQEVCVKLEKGNYKARGLRVTILERHPLHPKETQKFMGRGKCVEFHIPLTFASSMMGTDLNSMCDCVQHVLQPLLVTERNITDMERLKELGLKDNLEERTLWTVNVQTVSNIVLSDVRGMSIQATGLHVDTHVPQGQKHERHDVQLSLKNAFSRGEKIPVEEPLTVSNLTLSPIAVNGGATLDLYFIENMLSNDFVDDTFIEEWKNAIRLASERVDLPAIKTLLRVAALRCSSENRVSRCTFQNLLAFANALLPIPVAFF